MNRPDDLEPAKPQRGLENNPGFDFGCRMMSKKNTSAEILQRYLTYENRLSLIYLDSLFSEWPTLKGIHSLLPL